MHLRYVWYHISQKETERERERERRHETSAVNIDTRPVGRSSKKDDTQEVLMGKCIIYSVSHPSMLLSFHSDRNQMDGRCTRVAALPGEFADGETARPSPIRWPLRSTGPSTSLAAEVEGGQADTGQPMSGHTRVWLVGSSLITTLWSDSVLLIGAWWDHSQVFGQRQVSPSPWEKIAEPRWACSSGRIYGQPTPPGFRSDQIVVLVVENAVEFPDSFVSWLNIYLLFENNIKILNIYYK